MSNNEIIHVEGATMIRGEDRTILDGIDWIVSEGEHWALLGANGSGKTSLLKVICGYEWPTRGSVSVLGERYGETVLAEVRKRIGWVSSSLLTWIPDDTTGLAIALSGLEASVGLWREFSIRETDRAREALIEMGAEDIADKPYGVLSQGERQRALIARALINRPALIILDEPCAGLDPAAREHFLHDLERFARRKSAPTFIFVTHHVEEIPPFVTHALLLNKGRVLARGPLDRTMTDPLLSQTFGRPCAIHRRNGRFHLEIINDS